MEQDTTTTPPRSWREGRRLRAWELRQAGWTQAAIATALGVTQGAVSQWLRRAREGGGPAALHDCPPPGSPPRLTEGQLAALPALLARGPAAYGWIGDVWTTARVAQLIVEHFGVRYHRAHISRLLRRIGWSLQKPRTQATQRDQAAVAAWYAQRWPTLEKKVGASDEPSSG
jgi:transposase